MSGDRVPFSPGVVFLGGGAVLLLLLMIVGLLLPSSWEAGSSKLVDASSEAIFSYLDAPEGWRAWTPWPDSGVVREGPARGTGATLSWDDPELGSGSFRIVEVTRPSRVRYEVEVGGGAMRTRGTVSLLPSTSAEGVMVTWQEEGDLGMNPLMGFWALFMGRAQTTELGKGLERLDSLARGGPLADVDTSAAPTARDSMTAR